MGAPEPVDLPEATRRWLSEEAAGREAAADAAFGSVWAGFTSRANYPVGLADRVVAGVERSAAPPRATRGRRRRGPAVRMLLGGLGVGLAAYGTVALTPVLANVFFAGLSLTARSFVWVIQAFDSGLDVWTILARAGRTIGAAMTTPRVTLAFVAVELVAVAALYGLHRLLRMEKETKKW